MNNLIRMIIIIFVLFFGVNGFAATFKVTNTREFRIALKKAAGNGQDDTIILNAGVYKTTDDGLGTFVFSDVEPYDLTVKAKDGLTSNDVILDGKNADVVIKFKNPQGITHEVTLERVSIINGKAGGVDCDYNLSVTGSIISNNGEGEGLSGRGGKAVTNSVIME
ncbi:MAG: hypothetical protein HY757_05595 [Nitrospirae bacterium]|nr:hypothetical protein [Nitrospirota bacterium]